MKRVSHADFCRNLSDSGLLPPEEVAALETGASPSADAEALAGRLVAAGTLTPYQAEAVRQRRFDELTIGNYQILDRLGAGAMGTVYKARHRRMKRVVALKVLSRKVSESERFVRRFQREVEAIARLSHPNVVMAYDADEAAVGHFLVMEFVEGRDLDTLVCQNGPLPVGEAVDYVAQAARGLGYAHSQGIVHRDVKPSNLLLDVSGVVKVADLGLIRVAESQGPEGGAGLTQAGTIMGTVDFMSPEQSLGLPVDQHADVYSLGCTLHFLLLGRPPYQGATMLATLLEHREAAIPSLRAGRPDVPEALDQVFRRMVAKKPEDRFASMAEVAAALEALGLRAGHGEGELAPIGWVAPGPGRPAPGAPGSTDRTIDLAPARALGAAGPSVLLVEPARSQAAIIRGYLQKVGFANVPTVASGQEALKAARAAPPSLVVCTMQLADMTGMQLARQMRAEPALASAAFVLITSQSDSQEADPSGLARTVRLVKPFDLGQLAQALVAAGGALPQSPLRALVADDSAAARGHARQVLTTLGFGQVVEARDGAEAVALLEKERFDLIVTDYNMPRLDGRGLIDFVRTRSTAPATPVVMCTTETDASKLEAVRRLGVSAICDKSLPADVVRKAL